MGTEFLGSNLILWCNLKDEVWKCWKEGSSLRAKLRNWRNACAGSSLQLPARMRVRPSLQLAGCGFQLAAHGLHKKSPPEGGREGWEGEMGEGKGEGGKRWKEW